MDPNQIMEFFVRWAPYFGIYLLTQAIKSACKLKGRWVLLMICLVGWTVAGAQMIIEKVNFPPLEYSAWLFIRGISLAAASWFSRQIVKLFAKGKE
jgi:hypothetical protein